MNSGVVAIWDPDREYAEKLCDCLRRQGTVGPSVVSFCDLKQLRQAIEHRQVAVALVADEARVEDWLASVPVVFLTEQKNFVFMKTDRKEQETPRYVYKYQPVRQIARAISHVDQQHGVVREGGANCQNNGTTAQIRGIYAPLGGCLKTSLGLVMGCLLAEKKRCLFLSLEAHSGFRTLFGRQYPMDLADLFSMLRRGEDLWGNISEVLQPFGKLFYIPPVIWPVDIREAEASEWKELLCQLAVSGHFEEIVVDVGQDLARPERVLALCDQIYRPEKEDIFSQAKLAEYDCYLRVSGCEGILQRTKRIPISRLEAGMGTVSLNQWQRWEQMIPVVRQILEETEDERV